jgi:hypothetical protein
MMDDNGKSMSLNWLETMHMDFENTLTKHC